MDQPPLRQTHLACTNCCSQSLCWTKGPEVLILSVIAVKIVVVRWEAGLGRDGCKFKAPQGQYGMVEGSSVSKFAECVGIRVRGGLAQLGDGSIELFPRPCVTTVQVTVVGFREIGFVRASVVLLSTSLHVPLFRVLI